MKMAKYNLLYNFDQWVTLMETLREMKPPSDCGPGSNIATTIEIDGVVEYLEPGVWADRKRGFIGP